MDQKMLRPANIITASRILLSAVLLFSQPFSVPFGVIYLLCGLSDMMDGFVARKTHTESETGAKLDSAADALFFAVSAVKILPAVHLDVRIWVWAAVIAVIKIAGMLLRFFHGSSFAPPHSIANKLTGLLLFLLPLTIPLVDSCYSAMLVCTVATVAAVQDVLSEMR